MHHSQIPLRYKGNISLLVIFILLGSALIALLAMSQIKNLMRYGATTSNYFKAYYLAKAGLELAITETAIRDAGFQIEVNSWSAIVSGNIFLDRKGFDPYFEVRSTVMTKKYCKELQPNESIVIPLFLDNKNALSHKDALTSPGKGITPFTEGEVKKITATLTPTNDAFFGIFAYSGEEMIGMISKIGNNFNSLPTIDERTGSIFPTPTQNYRRYLTILNHHKNTPIMGCIESSSQPFALDTTTIEVWAHYGNTEVGLNSTFSEPFPDLLQGLSEVNWVG